MDQGYHWLASGFWHAEQSPAKVLHYCKLQPVRCHQVCPVPMLHGLIQQRSVWSIPDGLWYKLHMFQNPSAYNAANRSRLPLRCDSIHITSNKVAKGNLKPIDWGLDLPRSHFWVEHYVLSYMQCDIWLSICVTFADPREESCCHHFCKIKLRCPSWKPDSGEKWASIKPELEGKYAFCKIWEIICILKNCESICI